jgi:hypothetical protein
MLENWMLGTDDDFDEELLPPEAPELLLELLLPQAASATASTHPMTNVNDQRLTVMLCPPLGSYRKPAMPLGETRA